MFAVVFEVHPRPDRWDAYLDNAGMLKPELQRIAGFIENIRYRSLTREGWILSLSTWEDEKALVRWRTHARHHVVQEKGRNDIFLDYHLRVGQLTRDSGLPEDRILPEQRLDETQAGAGTTLALIDAKRPPQSIANMTPGRLAESLGLQLDAPGLVAWDVFEAVLTPGDAILLLTWRESGAAEAFEGALPDGARARRVRVVRDYGMFDRREAPQYYPDVRKEDS